LPNTGGGGGGIWNCKNSDPLCTCSSAAYYIPYQAGGSGVVIISTTQQAVATQGNPVFSTVNGRYIYKFTQSGTIQF